MFLHDASNMGRTTTLRQNAGAAGACIREETIAARPLQEIVPLDDLLRAKIIKIDVEGAEWPVLRGLEPMLSRLRPDVSIVVEVDGNALASYGVSIPEFLAFFAARGYRGRTAGFPQPGPLHQWRGEPGIAGRDGFRDGRSGVSTRPLKARHRQPGSFSPRQPLYSGQRPVGLNEEEIR